MKKDGLSHLISSFLLFGSENAEQQGEEEEDNGEAEGQPSNNFLGASFLFLGKDVKTAAGDGARSTAGFTALKKAENDDD